MNVLNLPGSFRAMPVPSKLLAIAGVLVSGGLVQALFAVEAAPPVSWHRDLLPVLQRSCSGCHQPSKLKGGVDTSSYEGFLRPGKHGPTVVPGNPALSKVIEEISGPEPSMPKEGEPLSPAEVERFVRWIREGATNDASSSLTNRSPRTPPAYTTRPAIAALAFSPDGHHLAVTAHHEVLLHRLGETGAVLRCAGSLRRPVALAFAPDGRRLAVAGGDPATSGGWQIWDTATGELLVESMPLPDTALSIAWSPDGTRLAVAGVDRSLRWIDAASGAIAGTLESHADAVVSLAWLSDGRHLASAGRDRLLKLVDAQRIELVDDLNKPLEPILCMARHPRRDHCATGGADGGIRVYKAGGHQERTSAANDINLVREWPRRTGPVHAVAWSPDGSILATAGPGGPVELLDAEAASVSARMESGDRAVFALVFDPSGRRLYAAGFDGLIRMFEVETGALAGVWDPTP